MDRQGDVLIVGPAEGAVPEHAAGAASEPDDGRGRLALAPGEVTAHAHAVVGPGRLIREDVSRVAACGRGGVTCRLRRPGGSGRGRSSP